MTKQYFGHLVEERLHKTPILESGFISSLFNQLNEIEERLSRVHLQVKNFTEITQSVGLPSNPNSGVESDEIIRNVWSELFTLDTFIHNPELSFTDFEKVVRRRDLPAIDFTAKHSNEVYAIEVTRVSQRGFVGTTLPDWEDAIYLPENLQELRAAIRQKLFAKNRQMQNFCNSINQVFDKKLIAIKLSQDEYSDGKNIVKNEITSEFKTGRYSAIDEIVAMYDVSNFHWIK